MAESLLAAVRHCQDQTPLQTLLAAPHVQAEVNKLGPHGVNALGLAVWRNHAGLVEALLEAGAQPDVQDTESGWSALHRALHWGQLRIAAALLQANASLALPDWRGRTPLDLLSADLKEYLEPGGDGDVFSWGNGSNYTLGTGSTDVQLHPARLEGLHDQQVAAISAAKFHSAAVTLDGRLLTWGWGRGGRLGHPDANIHSGEGAVIAPLVVSSLGRRAVAAVAAAKHHTLLCTTAGEVFSMGSNRHGQLGYAVDGQPTPRRVTSLRQRVVAVAAANKHSVAVTAGGDVYTWGSNVLGQLGYGTSDSVSNAAPRLVEAMRGKPVTAAAAGKRHTLVLTAAGEVYTWGHRGVSPRRVALAGARDALSAGGAPITFHRGHADVARPLAVAICAGAAHSSALTSAGVVLSWRSADPALQVQEVGGALAGKRVVSIAAGKYRTAAVSDEGDVYMWEGRSDYFPAEGRQPGSGSKKPGSGSATKARPIPGKAGGGGVRISLGGEAPLGGSYGSAEQGAGGGSYGSHPRRAGSSFIERFGKEREQREGSAPLFGTSPTGPSSFGASPSLGRGELSGGLVSRPSRASDVFEKIRPERVEGLKRAVAVAVGEKHSLAVQRWSAAQLEGMAAVPWLQGPAGTAAASPEPAGVADEDSWFQQAADGLVDGGGQLATPRGVDPEASGATSAPASPFPSPGPGRPSPVRPGPRRGRGTQAVGVPSLQRICEEEVARRLVDPRTCLQVLEYADVAGAELLRAYCLAVAVCNLDAVLLEAGGAFEELAPHLLAELEALYKLRLAGAGAAGQAPGGAAPAAALAAAEPAGRSAAEGAGEASGTRRGGSARPGSRLQPGRRPTAAGPWLGDADVGDAELQHASPGFSAASLAAGGSSFKDRSEADAEAAAQRLARTLQKKVQQIEHLEAKAAAGAALDPQQAAKVLQKPVVLSALAALQGGMALPDVHSILRAAGRDPELAASPAPAGGSKGAPAPASSGKQPKGKGKSDSSSAGDDPGASSSQAPAAAADPEALEARDASSSSLLGSSPPASALLPAFGQAGSAGVFAEQPQTPAAARDERSPPAGQLRSQVGFDSSATTDGVAAAAQRQSGQRQDAHPGSKPKSAAKRKGGLSMFLRGELEQAAPPAAPEAASGSSSSATAAPAWGARSAAPAGATSLKDILDKELEAAGVQATPAPPPSSAGRPPTGPRGTPGSGAKPRAALDSPGAAASASGGPLRMSLASFIQSSPVAVQQRRDGGSPPPPAWGGASGASPPTRQHTSFRAIQEEQEAQQPLKAYGASPPAVHRLGAGLPPWRPPQPQPGASLLGTSPAASGSILGASPSQRASSFLAAPVPQHSKWYVPEESRADVGKSLVSIQSEEEALQALARQYGADNVHDAPANSSAAAAAPKAKAAHVAQPARGGAAAKAKVKPATAADPGQPKDAAGAAQGSQPHASPGIPRPGRGSRGRGRGKGQQDGSQAGQGSRQVATNEQEGSRSAVRSRRRGKKEGGTTGVEGNWPDVQQEGGGSNKADGGRQGRRQDGDGSRAEGRPAEGRGRGRRPSRPDSGGGKPPGSGGGGRQGAASAQHPGQPTPPGHSSGGQRRYRPRRPPTAPQEGPPGIAQQQQQQQQSAQPLQQQPQPVQAAAE